MTRRLSRRGTVEVDGSLALVTGAGSGIGRATSLVLAASGARVVCTDRDAETAEATAAACSAAGPPAQHYAYDVADAASVEALARRLNDRHGAIDILVNNAGTGMSSRFLDMLGDDWYRILSVNLMGAVHHCSAFGPAMLERGRGQVVNISSALGYTPTATEAAYVTSKAAVLAMSRCLRADWHHQGVGVSAVCPGVIDTPIVRSNTVFRGGRADPASVKSVRDLFARYGHPPSLVAKAILGAIEHDRSVVPVGAEAWGGWLASRLLPVAIGDRIARVVRPDQRRARG